MRRAPIVIAATVAGTAGVLLFKPLAPATTVSAAGATTGSGSTGSSSTPTPSTSAAPSTSAGASAAPSSSATSTPAATSGTWTGTAVTTRYGTTQVRVTIAGGRLTAVTTLQMNENDPRSEQISSGAIPELRQEVLADQTAAVDTISGATYTSLAYEASLQAALDKAGWKAPDGKRASTAAPVVEGGH